MELMLDVKCYFEKPQGSMIGSINNRIINHKKDINVEQLAYEVSNGKSFVGATFKAVNGQLRRSIDNWESQQVIALDFDEGLTLDEAYKDSFFQDNAAFLYTTFSHTEEHHKFRVVFVLEEPIYNYNEYESIIKNLFQRYPYADKACKDGSRLFFGGKSVTPFNYNNTLDVEDYLFETPLQDIKSDIYMSDTRVRSEPEQQNVMFSSVSKRNLRAMNMELIRNRDIASLLNIINPVPIILSSTNEVYEHLKKQDLRKFLGVDVTSNFMDIFHDEINPSASIYQSNKGNGHWLYKCHSFHYPFTGTIFNIVEKLTNSSIVESKKLLMEIYKIEVHETQAVKEFKETIDAYKELLRSEDLEEIHPNFYKVFNRYGHLQDLYILLDLCKEFISDDTDPRIIFYHSVRRLGQHFGRSPSTTGLRMNYFTLFHLIKKLDKKQIDSDLYLLLETHKRQNNYQYISSVYEIPRYTYNLFDMVDDMCKIWIEKGCSSKTISYEGVYRTFDRDTADRVFPQDEGKDIPELNEEIVSMIHQTTMELIDSKGWTTEKEVLEHVKLYFRGQKEMKKQQFKRCIGEMLDAYDLEIINCNKQLKLEMYISEEQLSKHSFPRILRYIKNPVEDCSPEQGKEDMLSN
ncbi:hypothetical protein ABEV54_05790 [Peribacillus psychrosaccharolyticus]|uniref:hypothetical protein n=1 Tax=Peribacillus psychrosaccharolyticus TaxID=1407 RepID=UPI003D294DF4